MVQNLEGMGFTVVPFGQGFKDMSPPTKELMKLVLEEKLLMVVILFLDGIWIIFSYELTLQETSKQIRKINRKN